MKLLVVGLSLVALGVGILFAALLSASSAQLTQVGAVGCVVILFLPICFGAGSGQLVTWGMVMAGVLLLAAAVLQWLLLKRQEEKHSQ